jgi:hypothetical protein
MTNNNGIRIEHVATMPSHKAYYNKSVSGPTLDQVPVVCEYPDVFPEELPGMPLTRISSSLLNWFPEQPLLRNELTA